MASELESGIRELDRESPIPLYYQIAAQIRSWIESGEIKPGEKIPTERELQQDLDVSRATVRHAISELVYEGLLKRRRAIGTIVSEPKPEGEVYGFGSFTNEILKRELTPGSMILEFGIGLATEFVAAKLEIDPGDPVVAMERLRLVNEKPVAVERWYAPEQYLPGMDRAYLDETGAGQSTYKLLEERYGIRLASGLDTIEAVGLEKREADLLNAMRGDPALLRTRVSYTAQQVAIVYASGVYVIKLIISLESGKLNVVSS
jgi:GntR family transcriptional regulator